MDLAQSFAPLGRADARVLVLGSVPGQASLRAGQYYAHPRNAFWPIMAALFGLDPSGSYAQRTRALAASGVALWDVLAQCRRPGSLDANIEPGSVVPNDLGAFLERHDRLRAIFFNGAAAQALFRRYALSVLGQRLEGRPGLVMAQLPSTSPAHAALDFSAKLDAWRVVAKMCNPCNKSDR